MLQIPQGRLKFLPKKERNQNNFPKMRKILLNADISPNLVTCLCFPVDFNDNLSIAE